MKIFTLIVTFLLTVVTGFSQQNWGGTAPNCTLPEGFILSQGDRMETYNNPLNQCKEDCGIVTPGVGGNNPGNILFPAKAATVSTTGTSAYTTSVIFNLFIFDANLRCESNKDFLCTTIANLYIVQESYNSVQTPASSEIYGHEQLTLRALGQENRATILFTKAPVAGKKYRVFLDFGKGTPCIQQNTKYVIDLIPGGGPLPINVSSFLVARTTSAVALNWNLEAGVNVSKFEVERSFENTASFKSIATVTGNIGSTSFQKYAYSDNTNKSTSVSFYRLKIVKSSGEFSYSDIKTVKAFGGAKAGHILFPNPALGNARITISDISEPTKVQILDNAGRMVKSIILTNNNTVELNGLIKGSYMVRIIGTISGQSEVQNLTVIK